MMVMVTTMAVGEATVKMMMMLMAMTLFVMVIIADPASLRETM